MKKKPSKPTISKRTRALVVEFLRCAADGRPDAGDAQLGVIGMFDAARWLGYSRRRDDSIEAMAWKVRNDVYRGHDDTGTENYRRVLLEAAQRVEEESWP